MKILVMKFGGASVSSPSSFSHIAELILKRQSECPRLVIVVSAMGETTNNLIQLAKRVHPNPPQREYDMLISAGERISMSLLAMALSLKGAEAMSFTGSQSGIITCSRHSEARIIDVKPSRLEQCLENGKIAIVAGFQGVSLEKEVTTLGRGGSDTSAVALGLALKASHVEFYKDVPGVFDEDPKLNSEAIQYERMSYDQALSIVTSGAKILHNRAILLAKENGLPLQVRSFISKDCQNSGTLISDENLKNSNNPVYEKKV